MNDFAISGKSRTMTWAVPSFIVRVPANGAAHVRTSKRQIFFASICFFVHPHRLIIDCGCCAFVHMFYYSKRKEVMKLQLVNRKPESPTVESFVFTPSEPIAWQAGQFCHYVLHHEPTDDRGSDRWFTIASAPFENVIMITTKFTDDKGSTFKKELKNLQVGQSIEVSVVEGSFVMQDLQREYVFIAGGIGITPFHAILKQLDYEKKSPTITLLYANKDQDVVYKTELESFAKNNPNFKIQYVFSPEHIDENKIRQLIPDLQKPIFYVSGPEPMVTGLAKTLMTMGVQDGSIKRDFFPGYTEV